MDLGLVGKRVIVTSSSKGIGFAIAKRFLEEGASVVISSHNETNLEEARRRLEVLGKVYAVKATCTILTREWSWSGREPNS